MFEGISVLAIGLGVLVLVTLKKWIQVVPQGREFTVEKFGRYTRTLRPGLSFVMPYFHNIM